MTTTTTTTAAAAATTTDDAIQESVIRKMTRLVVQYKAINLSQGFPNEGPPWRLRLALAQAVLTGTTMATTTATTTTTTTNTMPPQRKQDKGDDKDDDDKDNEMSNMMQEESDMEAALHDLLSQKIRQRRTASTSSSSPSSLSHFISHHEDDDELNQYSPPMGRADLRQGIADYYQRLYNYHVTAEDHVTVTLGATEALSCALRTVGRPGDGCVMFQPFHELYAAQCRIFYLEPVFVTLRANNQTWTYNATELRQALSKAKIVLLNTPHNPTGKVFTRDELQQIVEMCLEYNVTIITDEIYEHLCFTYNNNDNNNNNNNNDKDDKDTVNKHWCIPQEFPQIRDRTLICNSLGKSASATGWRLGWCIHPSQYSHQYRGIHDQMAVMAPHPVQYATLQYLRLPQSYFEELRARYQGRVQRLAEVLRQVGFQVTLPQGTYYLFCQYARVLPNRTPEQAAMFLLTRIGVACVPGDNFYARPTTTTTTKASSSSAVVNKNDQGQEEEESSSCLHNYYYYLRFAACRSDHDLQEAAKRLQKLKEMPGLYK